jgi:hypothetical protein
MSSREAWPGPNYVTRPTRQPAQPRHVLAPNLPIGGHREFGAPGRRRIELRGSLHGDWHTGSGPKPPCRTIDRGPARHALTHGSDPGAAATGHVFVDHLGQRAWFWRRAGAAVVLIVGGYTALLLASLTSVPGIPRLSLPGPSATAKRPSISATTATRKSPVLVDATHGVPGRRLARRAAAVGPMPARSSPTEVSVQDSATTPSTATVGPSSSLPAPSNRAGPGQSLTPPVVPSPPTSPIVAGSPSPPPPQAGPSSSPAPLPGHSGSAPGRAKP